MFSISKGDLSNKEEPHSPAVSLKVALDARALVSDKVDPERGVDQLLPSSGANATTTTRRVENWERGRNFASVRVV